MYISAESKDIDEYRGRFNIKSCVKSLFGTVSMEMRRNITRGHSCIWFCTGEEQQQEPNAETDHPECSTPPGISTLGSTNLLKYPYVPLYSAGMYFFIKQTRWAGVLSVPKAGSSSNGGLQIMLPLFHSPLFHFKVGMPLTSKNFRSTFLSLVWWSNVATIQPNTTLALVQPLTVTADTIQKYIWCSHTHC
ncbi:hypothetical protein EMCRGX_G015647 [Ephydatia muelleri]